MVRHQRTGGSALVVGFLALALAALVLAPAAVDAQSILVEVRSQDTGEAIRGAFATLLSEDGESIRSALTNASGRYLFVIARPGTYRVRVEMMGRETETSSPFLLDTDRNLVHRVGLSTKAISVEGFEVNGERVCRVRPFEATTTATVWEEARKALEVTAWGERVGAFRYRIERHTRDLDREAQAVESEGRRSATGYYYHPFESRPADVLAREGFVQESPDGDIYYAPDAQVLLSNEFLDTHCMGLMAPEDPESGVVGVAFEPVPGRRVPDIRGTFWVDRQTGELKSLDFSYANLDPSIQDVRIGGDVDFLRLPDGHWIVQDWRIRMPRISMVYRGRPTREATLSGFREEGGEVLSVHDARGALVLEAARGTIQGTLRDENTGQPIRSKPVWIEGVGRETTTDDDGQFRFTGLAEGVYRLRTDLPMARILGLEPDPTLASVTPGEIAHVSMVVPSTESMVRSTCLQAVGSDTAVAVIGHVVDAESGEPIPDALVQVWWNDLRFRARETLTATQGLTGPARQWWATWGEDRRGVETWSGEGGAFAVCGPRPDHPLSIHATLGPFSSDTTEVRIPQGESVLDRDLHVQTGGIGSLSGMVVDFQTKTALPSATVTMEGSEEIRMSDETGMFTWDGLQVGGYLMTVELLGYATLEDSVIIGPGQNLQVEVQLPSEAFQLEPIVVEVMRGTLESALGVGRSVNDVTRAEIQALESVVADLTGVIRRSLGNQVRITMPVGGAGITTEYCVQAKRRSPLASGGCQPVMLVVDGVTIFAPSADSSILQHEPMGQFQEVLSLPPDRVESAHFLTPVEGRFRYGPQGRFGVLVIQTRSGG